MPKGKHVLFAKPWRGRRRPKNLFSLFRDHATHTTQTCFRIGAVYVEHVGSLASLPFRGCWASSMKWGEIWIWQTYAIYLICFPSPTAKTCPLRFVFLTFLSVSLLRKQSLQFFQQNCDSLNYREYICTLLYSTQYKNQYFPVKLTCHHHHQNPHESWSWCNIIMIIMMTHNVTLTRFRSTLSSPSPDPLILSWSSATWKWLLTMWHWGFHTVRRHLPKESSGLPGSPQELSIEAPGQKNIANRAGF